MEQQQPGVQQQASALPSTPIPSPSATTVSQIGTTMSDRDSAAGAVVSVEHPIPPRRRLVKAASAAAAAAAYGRRGHVEATREGGGGGGGGGPPGFVSPGVLDRSGTSSPTVPGSGTGAPGAMASGGVQPPASNSLSGGFRDRERGSRASTKGEMQGDQSTHGNSGSGKLGRNAYANAGAMEARPLGHRPEMNVRRHESPSQKYAEEMRLQQAKRAALGRAQSMGAPGNFKSFDSPFGNFMLPVIPLQFYNKPQSPAASSGALAAPSVPSTPIGGGLDR